MIYRTYDPRREKRWDSHFALIMHSTHLARNVFYVSDLFYFILISFSNILYSFDWTICIPTDLMAFFIIEIRLNQSIQAFGNQTNKFSINIQQIFFKKTPPSHHISCVNGACISLSSINIGFFHFIRFDCTLYI